MPDLKTQLGDYLDHVVQHVDVDEFLEQLRAGDPPGLASDVVSPVTVIEQPASVRRWPLAVAAAAAVVLVVAAVVVWSSRSDSDTEIIDQPPTTTAPVTTTVPLTTVAPEPFVGVPPTIEVVFPTELLDTGVTSSLIGDLRWTALSGDPAVLPATAIVETPTGFASLSGERHLLQSADGITWDAVAPPVPGLLLGLTADDAGTYQLLTNPTYPNSGRGERWESTDLVSGRPSSELDSVSEFIRGSGFVEGVLNERATTAGGAVLSEGEFWIDWTSIALLVGGDDLQQRLDSGLIVGGPRFDPASGIVDFDLFESRSAWNVGENPQPSGVQVRVSISGTSTDWTIVVEDAETGETITSVTGSIGGLPLDATLEALASGRQLSGSFVSSGDEIERLEPPWSDTNQDPSFVTIDESVVAYVQNGEPPFGPTEIWRSDDARSWDSLGEAPAGYRGSVLERDGVVLARFDASDQDPLLFAGPDPASIRRSTDGVTWAPLAQPPMLTGDNPWPDPQLLATETGWLFITPPYNDDALAVWTSLDGDTWEQADTSAWEAPDTGSSSWGSNDRSSVLSHTMSEPPSPVTVWIIEWG